MLTVRPAQSKSMNRTEVKSASATLHDDSSIDSGKDDWHDTDLCLSIGESLLDQVGHDSSSWFFVVWVSCSNISHELSRV